MSNPKITQEQATQIRNGLFLAPSRSFGEQYLEALVRAKYQLSEPTSNDHDGADKNGNRYEIKGCKVLSATGNTSKSKSIWERIIFENLNVETNRLIHFSDRLTADYLANVQNVKRDHFKTLIYVLFFENTVKIFFCRSEEIANIPNWSGKHGRYDALGKSGQFGITKSNIQWHIDNTLRDSLTYGEVAGIYSNLQDTDAS